MKAFEEGMATRAMRLALQALQAREWGPSATCVWCGVEQQALDEHGMGGHRAKCGRQVAIVALERALGLRPEEPWAGSRRHRCRLAKYRCAVCGQAITRGQRYFDTGYVRAHEGCVPKVDQPPPLEGDVT